MRIHVLILVFFFVAAFAAPQVQDDTARASASALASQLSTTADARTQVELIRVFVLKYPDNDRAAAYLGIAVNQLCDSLHVPAEAVALAQQVVDATATPDGRFAAQKVLASAFGKSGQGEALKSLWQSVSPSRTLDYWDTRAFADAFFFAGDFRTSSQLLDDALKLTSYEIMARELMPKGWTKENIESLSNRRATPALVMKARAAMAGGDFSSAESALDRAAALAHMTFFGIRDEEVNLYLGELQIKQGQYAAALDTLSPDALMGGDERALGLMRIAWKSLHGSDDDFTAECDRRTAGFIRPAPDFTVRDYAGNAVLLSSLRGKVVLLNFWFPT